MLKKLKNLCLPIPRSPHHQSPLDNLAMEVFKQARDQEFVLSTASPERRYLIDVDETILLEHNLHVEKFERYGPNERYLINKIFYSPSRLLYIVGGIGVGKTRFSHFLIDELLPAVCHPKHLESSKCPCAIYIDFLDLGDDTFAKQDFEEIKVTFSEILCDRVEDEIETKGFFDLETEISLVWASILSEQFHEYQKNPAFSFIQAKLRSDEAGPKALTAARTETLRRRKKIRKAVMANKDLRRFYLGRLLRYIQKHFYEEHNHCLLIVIDNIDREPQMIQRAVDLVIKPFSRHSSCRIIVNARQTTFHQGQGDSYSEPIDRVAYCGPSPLDVLHSRLERLNPKNDRLQQNIKGHDLAILSQGMTEIRTHFLKRDPFTAFFLSLCGRSIRKGLILGQHLIHNSVYDPYELGRVGVAGAKSKTSDILRALIIGADDTFSYSGNGVVENLFQVQAQPGEGYLAKLRILKAIDVREDYGLRVGDLIGILGGFGYSMDLMLDALQELLLKSKRLIWSDAVWSFESQEDLIRQSNSRLLITSIGKGYVNFLYRKVEYIQEMMLDTQIPPDAFGPGGRWDYSRIEDRLKLVFLFCSFLLAREEEEVERFLTHYGPEHYKKVFAGGTLFSRTILQSTALDVQSILNFVLSHSHGRFREELMEFRETAGAFYEDYLIRSKNIEEKLFER